MSNSWIAAAERMETHNKARKVAEREAASKQAVAANAERSAQELLEQSVEYGAQLLTEFMNEHGEVATRLLAARGDKAYVLFGVEQDGGSYTSVYLYEGGLGTESGYNGLAAAYDKSPQKTPPTRAATPKQAVHFFAYYGSGRRTPENVRNVVIWLSRELDKIASIVKTNS